jgi:hypothetical protein
MRSQKLGENISEIEIESLENPEKYPLVYK